MTSPPAPGCGLYCGACAVYLAMRRNDAEALAGLAAEMGRPVAEVRCEGCASRTVMDWCRRCAVLECLRRRGLDYCHACPDFPCGRLAEFRDQYAHHGPVIENLRRIAEVGAGPWLEEQQARWRCGCGRPMTWYDQVCPACGRAFYDCRAEARDRGKAAAEGKSRRKMRDA